MRLIIDTDNGLGGPLNLFPPKGNLIDIDDGLAIILAVQSTKLDVEGITTVFGVSNPRDSRICTEELLEILNRKDIPVLEGARNKKEFGRKTRASNFLIKKFLESDGDLSLCTLGPLTNIATAFKQEPSIVKKINKVAIMGGYLPQDNILARLFPTEFNFNLDIPAVEYVIKLLQEEGVPTIITDMNVCTQVSFSAKQISILKSVKNPLSNYILKHIKYFYYLQKALNPLGDGFHPWDPICIATLIDESMFEMKSYWTDLDTFKLGWILEMGGLIKVLKRKPDKYKSPIKFCTKIDGNRFLNLLMKALIGKKV